ncbi:hypothetical protein EVAR_242_1 [Eumeta japonica]|uniref:RNase H type-1 domain-containing protein n=1 Tax=Eumeta variegata TaxID=151549 RepID=A0A4C1SCF2_EUMVA|nr:hypothetical protein EVAR_242_1 [Eumeta japonica]
MPICILKSCRTSSQKQRKNVRSHFRTASRLQRYAARLAACDYSVEWVSTVENSVADAFLRLPLLNDPAR